ncbi:MAG: RNA polymerase sigma factor SigJ [Acidobacteriota bacterium]
MVQEQLSNEQVTQLRNTAFPLVYRMVGSVAETEDLIQEGLLRFQIATERGTSIDNPHAFFVSVTTRLAIDHLRSARHKRELYPGEWLPEPIVDAANTDSPPERIEMAESLSLAFLVLLETLSPLERAVFLLRQVFDYEYAEIAPIVGKSEANCRQVFSRAKRHIAEKRPRFEPSPQERDRLANRFFATCKAGSLAELEAMLASDVEFHGDGGGVAAAVAHTVSGSNRVARLMHGIFTKTPIRYLVQVQSLINGQPGLLIKTPDDALIAVMALQIVDGKVAAVHSIINPDKLHHHGKVSDAARLKKPLAH